MLMLEPRLGSQPIEEEEETMAPTKEELTACQEHLKGLIAEKMCAPILVRLAWHDSGTYDKDAGDFPACGGANGSIRFEPEINHGGNAGLRDALAILTPVKEAYPTVGWADLMQVKKCGKSSVNLG
jgi:L-ascorbate peroxidase